MINEKTNVKIERWAVFWMIYFFVFLLMNLLGYIVLFRDLNLLDLIDIIFSVPGLIAIYGLAFKKKMGTALVWKVYFYSFVIWYFIFNYILRQNTGFSVISSTMIFLAYLALYIYAFIYVGTKEVD